MKMWTTFSQCGSCFSNVFESKAVHLCPPCFNWPLSNHASAVFLPAKCQPAPVQGLPFHHVPHPFLNPRPPLPSGEAYAFLVKSNALNAYTKLHKIIFKKLNIILKILNLIHHILTYLDINIYLQVHVFDIYQIIKSSWNSNTTI